jgi:hypothetical protein
LGWFVGNESNTDIIRWNRHSETNMSAIERPSFQARRLLLATLAGAAVSGASTIAYVNSEQQVHVLANIAIGTIAMFIFPGYLVSAYITNIHDANLILAGVVNFILYGGLSLWLLTWRSKRKLAARPAQTSQ